LPVRRIVGQSDGEADVGIALTPQHLQSCHVLDEVVAADVLGALVGKREKFVVDCGREVAEQTFQLDGDPSSVDDGEDVKSDAWPRSCLESDVKDPEFLGGSRTRLRPGGWRCFCDGSPEEVFVGVA
jgi:hypothetical protein